MARTSAMLEDRTLEEDRQRLLRELPGPMREMGKEEALVVLNRAVVAGTLHKFWFDWAVKSGGPGQNIVFPTSVVPQGEMPYLDAMIVISNPKDARRMARAHVRKAKTYGIAFLGKGVLSTRDIDDWREQREHLSEAFLPMASLAKIFDVSRARAEFAANTRLAKEIRDDKGNLVPVEINEFLLYEAMAQLQLSLLGEDPTYMDETNVPLRQSFKKALTLSSDVVEAARVRSESRRVVHGYSNGVVDRSFDSAGCPRHIGAAESLAHPECPVSGPLMSRIADVCPDSKVKRDNASTFLFAGHDTTANLMTHFIYYVVTNPGWQEKVQAEADRFMAKGEALRFQDLQELSVIKRCINETLRLAPSVPNGTFREVQYDDFIEGPNGEPVKVSKGQPFVVPPWSLHHNKELWGDDVEEFNPDRKWLPEEDWFGDTFRAYNPESERYCPFTFGPRSCIGRPFAMMEARLILAALFHKYTFELAGATKAAAGLSEISVNIGTLGPANGMYVLCHPRNA
mmetsp:Transcript_26411/g.74739  ORF Transcript_26411/g.74739 Transcript_26411/m.74739 type:complete len:513 (-) Transcript_26411:1409-2947(-)